LLSATPGWAQQASPASIVGDTIVVTAQQREQRLIDVPITVNAFDAEEIADRRINNLQDLSFAVPEMINVVTGMAQNRVMLRGVGEGGGNFPLVSIYLDDVAASGPLRGPLDIRPLDVERIEVLNGPQGTLYGQESVGGVVRFLTANPVIGQNSLMASADVPSASKLHFALPPLMKMLAAGLMRPQLVAATSMTDGCTRFGSKACSISRAVCNSSRWFKSTATMSVRSTMVKTPTAI